MRRRFRQLSSGVLAGLVFWSASASAQISWSEPPPLVRFTGTLLPLTDKIRRPTLTVFIKGKRWGFRIAKVQKLTGSSPDGWRLVRSLFPPMVHFVGPERLLSLLQERDTLGRRLSVEGHLYVGSRLFLVMRVERIAKAHVPEASCQPPPHLLNNIAGLGLSVYTRQYAFHDQLARSRSSLDRSAGEI